MKYHNITHADMLNGEGLRVVLWVSGCSHHCPACQNVITWNCNDGLDFDDAAKEEIFKDLEEDWCSGITLSGGDPLFKGNRADIVSLVCEIREKYPTKSIWLYTGYEYSFLMQLIDEWRIKWTKFNDAYLLESILEKVNILVAGPFVEEEKDRSLAFKGSHNQEIIELNNGE